MSVILANGHHSKSGLFESLTKSCASDLERLSWQVWIRAVQSEHARASGVRLVTTGSGRPQPSSDWLSLAQKLQDALPHGGSLPQGAALPGLMGVVREGNDPRQVVRRIPREDFAGSLPEGLSSKPRTPSGRATGRDASEGKIDYVQVPLDLWVAAKAIFPAMSSWATAYLWILARPEIPSLEELHMAFALLMRELDVYNPAQEEYRPFLRDKDYDQLARLPERARVQRYADSLALLARMQAPAALSLLGVLVAESFLTDQDLLLDLHRDAFSDCAERLLADPWMADIRDKFERLVSARVLACTWSLPSMRRSASIRAPFVTMDAWKRLKGIDEFIWFGPGPIS